MKTGPLPVSGCRFKSPHRAGGTAESPHQSCAPVSAASSFPQSSGGGGLAPHVACLPTPAKAGATNAHQRRLSPGVCPLEMTERPSALEDTPNHFRREGFLTAHPLECPCVVRGTTAPPHPRLQDAGQRGHVITSGTGRGAGPQGLGLIRKPGCSAGNENLGGAG